MCVDNAPPAVDAVDAAGGAGAILTGRLRSGNAAAAAPPAFCRRVRVRGDFAAFGLLVGVVGVVDVGEVDGWPGDGAAVALW